MLWSVISDRGCGSAFLTVHSELRVSTVTATPKIKLDNNLPRVQYLHGVICIIQLKLTQFNGIVTAYIDIAVQS